MMSFKMRARTIAPALLGAVALTVALVPSAFNPMPAAKAANPIYLVSNLTQNATGFTRNFNPFNANAADWTLGAIYEPLMIITPVRGSHTYPWLATSYQWANGNRTLLVNLRHGVRFSDGVPMTSADVAFTFNYGKTHAAADQNGLWGGHILSSVTAMGPYQVAFHFATLDTTILPNVLSTNIKILPQHIWSKVKDPGSFANPNPVGTGPFANVSNFTSQEFYLLKNRYYWQKLSYDGIKVPNYIDNNGANTAMEAGQQDWTGNFVPDIQKVYVAKDPAHFHYYFDNQNPLGLWFNDQKYPYSLTGFRQAVSMAIDRNAVSQIGENGYELPADAIGIKLPYASWYDHSLDNLDNQLSSYNPTKASALLKSLGFKMQGGQLMDPHGGKVSVQLSVPSGWSDWVLSSNIIVKNLKAIGIDASFKGLDQPVWFIKSQEGLLDAHIHWTNFGISPYYNYYGYMSQQSFTPTGTDASLNGQTNWERYVNSQATNLLAQFRATTDVQKQHALMDKIEMIQLQQMPFIPIMYSADWYTYSTRNFTGWPTQQNFYVRGSANDYPDRVYVLTHIHPVM